MLSHFSCVQLFASPLTVACQGPLSMEFSRQEFWSGLLLPSPGDLPDPRMEPRFPVSPALAGGFFTTEPPGKPGIPLRRLKSQVLAVSHALLSGCSSDFEDHSPEFLLFLHVFACKAQTALCSRLYLRCVHSKEP